MKLSWIEYKHRYFAAYHADDRDAIARLIESDHDFAMYCETDIREGRIPAKVEAKPRGRPATTGRTGGNHTIYMSDSDWQALQAVGNGSASAGIRKLLAGQASSNESV